MGAGKVLVGLIFVIVGVVLLVIGIAPIPGLETISVYYNITSYFSIDYAAVFSTFDLTPILTTSGYLSISTIIPMAGYYYCKAGIKSMRYDKEKKQYYYNETKIGLMIFGFILVVVAVTVILTYMFDILTPLIGSLDAMLPISEFWGLIPDLLLPTVIVLLIVFFVYWIGSKIMKTAVRKEEIFK